MYHVSRIIQDVSLAELHRNDSFINFFRVTDSSEYVCLCRVSRAPRALSQRRVVFPGAVRVALSRSSSSEKLDIRSARVEGYFVVSCVCIVCVPSLSRRRAAMSGK
jgi:hypothetical protein